MINVKNGSISFLDKDDLITSITSLQEFKKSKLYKRLSDTRKFDSFLWLNFDSIKIGGNRAKISLIFKDDKIVRIQFSINVYNKEATWDDWKLETEKYSKKKHDIFLYNEIGEPPYNYKWGTIKSVYDNKGGFSSIIISYN